jgi:hypothetical protein
MVDGITGCADSIDVGEASYRCDAVLAPAHQTSTLFGTHAQVARVTICELYVLTLACPGTVCDLVPAV